MSTFDGVLPVNRGGGEPPETISVCINLLYYLKDLHAQSPSEPKPKVVEALQATHPDLSEYDA